MEQLLHFTWKYRYFPPQHLATSDDESVDIIDVGLHNFNAGPDFFNAKVRIGGHLWVGNVEIHLRSSDWYRHGHEKDPAYNNTVLHVATEIDRDVVTQSGIRVPQMQLSVPDVIRRNYEQLLRDESFPPCYRIVPTLPSVVRQAWLSALTTERFEQKTQRIQNYLERTQGDWERTFFVALARTFGFGVNSEAFEQWALHLNFAALGKHRDNMEQVEALFFGQAGLLEPDVVPEERRDEYFSLLLREYSFLKNKFGLTSVPASSWRMLRLRPQNFPCVRLSQLADLCYYRKVDFSRILAATSPKELRTLLAATATLYWQTHYTFGHETPPTSKTLRSSSLDLLMINTIAPLLFAYGRSHSQEDLCDRAFELLESIRAEKNYITRSWEAAGISAQSAADSQALIQLKLSYCDRRDCLRCRFGAEYLKSKAQNSVLR